MCFPGSSFEVGPLIFASIIRWSLSLQSNWHVLIFLYIQMQEMWGVESLQCRSRSSPEPIRRIISNNAVAHYKQYGHEVAHWIHGLRVLKAAIEGCGSGGGAGSRPLDRWAHIVRIHFCCYNQFCSNLERDDGWKKCKHAVGRRGSDAPNAYLGTGGGNAERERSVASTSGSACTFGTPFCFLISCTTPSPITQRVSCLRSGGHLPILNPSASTSIHDSSLVIEV